jgi:hypothetical protein
MDRARHVCLELGRHLLSGEVKPEQSKNWTERELARQEADRRPDRRRGAVARPPLLLRQYVA